MAVSQEEFTMAEILKEIGDFLRAHIKGVLLLLVLLLIIKFFGPQIWAWLTPALPYITLVLAIIIILAIVIALADGGTVAMPGPCSLITYKIKPDQCVNVACTGGVCVETRGPYPKGMGSWAPFTQATGCSCPATAGIPAYSALMTAFAKAKGKLAQIGDQQTIRKQILDLMPPGLDATQQGDLDRILDKLGRGEDLSAEDYEKLKGILEHPN
jgi:hypothetical protein